MQGCYYPHFRHLLAENREDLAPAQKKRIRKVLRCSRTLYFPALIEKIYYRKRVENTKIEHPPVFIVGHWRSGTTYLFNLLSCDSNFSFTDSITTFTYHNYIWLRRILPHFYNKTMTGDRVGDDLDFLPHSPQEECYAIANTIDETFTHLVTFPQNAQHYIDLSFEDGMTPAQQEKWGKTHRYLLKKLTYYRGGKRILFKSPDNTAKVGMLHRLYPDAKFIHIYRDPYKSILSTINMLQEGIPLVTFEDIPDTAYITDMTIQFYKRIYTQYLRDIQAIPKENLIEIAYSELVKAPIDTLRQIYAALSLPDFGAAAPQMQAHIDSQKSHKSNKFTLNDPLREKINSELGFFFRHYNIPMQTGKEESPNGN